MFKSILVAVAAAALVSADNILSVTSPLANAVYNAGSPALITWINPTVDVISQIQLSQGLSTALQPVMIIANNVSASDMKYTWDIPATLPAGTDYAFVFGTSPNLSYTGQFTIKNGATAPSSSGAAASSAPASSSAAAASSSAAVSPAPVASSSTAPKQSSAPAGSSSSSSPSASAKPSNAAGKTAPAVVSAMAVVGAAAIALM